MNREDIIDVLTAITAVDRRTVGQADVIVWHDIIGDLPKDLALQAVRDHARECPDVWLQPGHIYQRVRAIRRDMLEREPDEMREARQERLAVKVAQDVAELAAAKAIPDAEPPKYIRPSADPTTGPLLQVACPYCRASVGQRCISQSTRQPMRRGQRAHPSRIDAARSAPKHAPKPAEDAACSLCTACGIRPLVADEDAARGVCTPCVQASTPQQPKTEVPERSNA